LTPNQTATVSVAFDPAAAQSYSGTLTIGSNASNSPTTSSLSGTGTSSGGGGGGSTPTCGTSLTIGPSGSNPAAPVSGDTAAHAAPSYTTFTPDGSVAIGGKWNDQNYSCPITRLTDAYNDGFDSTHSEHHFYVAAVLNQNDDRVIVIGNAGSTYILDTSGHRIVNPSAITNMANSTGSGIYWGRAGGEQYTLYWKTHSGSSYNLVKADISGCTASAPCSSLSLTTVYASSCSSYNNNNEDDLRINATSGHEYVGWDCNGSFSLLNVTSGTMGPAVNTGNTGFDNYKIVRGAGSTMYLCVNNGSGSYGNSTQGVWCYDQNGSTVAQLTNIDQHANTVWDPATSTAYWVMEQAGNDTAKTTCNGSPAATGIEAISIASTPVRHCLWEWPNWYIQGHISGSDLGVLSYDTIFGSGVNPLLFNPYASMDTNWSSDWTATSGNSGELMGEVLLISTSGGKIYRLANHRSRPNNGGSQDYWSTPRSSLSIDGKYVVFDSNVTHGCCSSPGFVSNYSDVYMIGPLQ
jgi:hypothetical protein